MSERYDRLKTASRLKNWLACNYTTINEINKIIKKPALTFFNNCKKKNKKIKDKYDLKGKDWEKYNKLDREIYFGYHSSDTIESILVDRKKRKN